MENVKPVLLNQATYTARLEWQSSGWNKEKTESKVFKQTSVKIMENKQKC